MVNPLRTNRSRRALSLPAHVLVMVAGGLALLAAVLWLLTSDATSPLSDAPTDQTVLEVVRLAFYAVAGIGGVIALTVAYRRQRMSEAEIDREDAKLFNERFAAAAEQLASERAANRLAGVYAMAALADEWDSGRQTCVNVLCAYMRMPYEPPPRRVEREAVGLEPFREVLEERLVRKTVLAVIGGRLRALPVEGRTWHWCDFDFTGATFDEGNLRGAVFNGRAVFAYARFPISRFNLNGTRFNGPVSFSEAHFSGATVSFEMSQFHSDADFTDISVTGGRVSFAYASFHRSRAHFENAVFAGGAVPFARCRFTAGTELRFVGASFSGAEVSFTGIEFAGASLTFERPAAWTRPPIFDAFPEGTPPNLLLPSIDPKG
ncbi:pentapeptide repeat-containing protein [Glycomyces paridis]|uniref:Pentapeptide repeat-containing protein n=1 Tax=Glycomyces paridis TaxID=2126555 RepID=A0A4V4HMC5_9ACTN|nr:pentapeptide repeat-containing protein [Glycomyces paridis]THV21696.1 pentapeptide repeat-containing protein [Glycomyces paridis]